MMTASSYPEHEKMQSVADASQAIGEFLEWMEFREVEVEDLYSDPRTITTLLAEYFNIDQNRLEAEKRQMLSELRNQHA